MLKIKIKLFPGFTINQFTKLSLCLLKSYYDILITQIFLIKGCNYYFCTVMVTESLVTSLSLCVMDYLGLRQLFGDILLEKLSLDLLVTGVFWLYMRPQDDTAAGDTALRF